MAFAAVLTVITSAATVSSGTFDVSRVSAPAGDAYVKILPKIAGEWLPDENAIATSHTLEEPSSMDSRMAAYGMTDVPDAAAHAAAFLAEAAGTAETTVFETATYDETPLANAADVPARTAPSESVPAPKAATSDVPMGTASERIESMKAEYPVAGRVYEVLSGQGWNDVAIAGVLGNMMAEVGGQTLSLKPGSYGEDKGGRYYGLCQWSLAYNPSIEGTDMEFQMDYLLGNVATNMTYFGGSLDGYLALTDADAAGRYFCSKYERGAGENQRAENAVVAYDWICSF